VSLAATLLLADACIMASGVLWLSRFARVSVSEAVVPGLVPFWAGEILKIALIALLLPSTFRPDRRPNSPC
jgi:biotin transporter BioY